MACECYAVFQLSYLLIESSATRVAKTNPHEVSRRQASRQVESRYMGERTKLQMWHKNKKNYLSMGAILKNIIEGVRE